jgi:hypothetical protein
VICSRLLASSRSTWDWCYPGQRSCLALSVLPDCLGRALHPCGLTGVNYTLIKFPLRYPSFLQSIQSRLVNFSPRPLRRRKGICYFRQVNKFIRHGNRITVNCSSSITSLDMIRAAQLSLSNIWMLFQFKKESRLCFETSQMHRSTMLSGSNKQGPCWMEELVYKTNRKKGIHVLSSENRGNYFGERVCRRNKQSTHRSK